jgi:putative membrane protein
MVKDFITNDHRKEKLSDTELFNSHRQLVHRHVAWLKALRYQMREEKPCEQHLKDKKSNKEFRKNHYLVCEDTISIEDAIKD